MTSLDNFHTGNASMRPMFPDELHRMNIIGLGLNQPRAWDIPNSVPVANLKHSNDQTHRPEPRITEHWDNRSKDLFVSTKPYTYKLKGDNVESMLLVSGNSNPMARWWHKWGYKGGTSTSNVRNRPY